MAAVDVELHTGPADDGIGECVVSSIMDPADGLIRLDIGQADSRVALSVQLLAVMQRLMTDPPAEGVYAAGHGLVLRCPHPAHGQFGCPVGDVVRIDAGERSVAYQITGPHPRSDAWIMERQDENL